MNKEHRELIYQESKKYAGENSPQQVSLPAFSDGAFFGYNLATKPISSEASGDEEKDKEIDRLKGLIEKAYSNAWHEYTPHYGWGMKFKKFKTDNNL